MDGDMGFSGLVWGVAHVRPFAADLAARDLRELGLAAFAPKFRKKEISRRSRRGAVEVIVERPMFRGYVFAGWPCGSELWAKALEARGVLDLLRSCGKLSEPSRVPQRLMQGFIDAGEIIDLTKKQDEARRERFKPGDFVTIKKAAFDGEVWRIARLDHRSRIRFILQSCRPGFEKFEVKASAGDLEKALAKPSGWLAVRLDGKSARRKPRSGSTGKRIASAQVPPQ